jgi:hypothetical protein
MQILYTFVLRAEIATIFGPNVVAIQHAIQKYPKFANLQGYIFRILQHFATTLCNFTHFSMLFRGIYFFCPNKKLVYNGNCLLGFDSFNMQLSDIYHFASVVCEKSKGG